jgi:hypothetical protein
MWRLFGSQLPAALEATLEVTQRCEFRLPLAERAPVYVVSAAWTRLTLRGYTDDCAAAAV